MLGFIKIVLCVGLILFNILVRGAPSILSNQPIQNDEILTTVVDMNSSNAQTSAILSQFNISREDVERKLSQINDSNTDNDSRR